MSSKKETVIRAFRGEAVDRIPVGFWKHYIKDFGKFNAGLEDKAVIEENLAGARKFKEEFDPDFVKIMTDGYFYIPVVGDTLDTVEVDESKKAAYIADFVKLIEGYRGIYGDDTFLAVNIFSPLGVVQSAISDGFGDNTPRIQNALKTTPEKVLAAVSRVADGIIDVINASVKPGLADGIYFSVNTLGNTIPEDEYKAFIAPAEGKIIAAANKLSQDNILHICGYMGSRNNLNIFKDYDVEVINWAVYAENFGLKEGKQFFGNKAVIGGFGNTKNDILYKGTKEEIEAEVKKIIADVGRAGVIVGADCTVPSDIDIERLKWVRDALK